MLFDKFGSIPKGFGYFIKPFLYRTFGTQRPDALPGATAGYRGGVPTGQLCGQGVCHLVFAPANGFWVFH